MIFVPVPGETVTNLLTDCSFADDWGYETPTLTGDADDRHSGDDEEVDTVPDVERDHVIFFLLPGETLTNLFTVCTGAGD